jgi:diaminopimelate decarboxylase
MNVELWGLTVNHKDHLVLGGFDVVTLAEAYGTPLHLVNGQQVRANYRSFAAAFRASYPNTRVYYSYKSNCIPGVLRILHADGCGAEVVSPYELWLTVKLDVPGADVIYNGVNKSVEDLRTAIGRGVGLINVDTIEEIQRLKRASEELAKPVNLGIRIDPGVGWKAQFGIQAADDQILTISRAIKESKFLNLCGLHVHIGTGLRRTIQYVRAIARICGLIRKLRDSLDIVIDDLDLGGGFGVPTVKHLTIPELALYRLLKRCPRPPRIEDCPSPERFGRAVAGALRRGCERHGLREPRLRLEPGRALTSNTQALLVTVRDIKRRSNGTTFAIADGGMQNIAFPLSYEYHHCIVANKARAERGRRYFVTGPLCSPEDVLYRNWKLPELKPGDLLAIMDAGAYFTSFANNFSYPRAPVVLVADGETKLIRGRETFERMAALDQL